MMHAAPGRCPQATANVAQPMRTGHIPCQLTDMCRPRPTSADLCVHPTNDASRPHPTSADRCVQTTDNAGRPRSMPRPMSPSRCAQIASNACRCWLMLHAVGRRQLVDAHRPHSMRLALDRIHRSIWVAFQNNPTRRQRLVVRQGPDTTGLSPFLVLPSRGLRPGSPLRTLLHTTIWTTELSIIRLGCSRFTRRY
ncbi:hypothetical protein H5410_044056 [Solanum commersonii]|uniref:Uncharacterized protein n=1 Tax=Solanum commersonii TaxID=4109 RepID=A0A9J5Y347_SOLCO|nr:hypothetical protein H5410_044056 [Solanum commersonii]